MKTRCTVLRGRGTRQIWLNARSIVSSTMIAVTNRKAMPTAVSRAAFVRKLFRVSGERRGRFRKHVAHQEPLDMLQQLAENRKRRDQRQRHRDDRHDGKEHGESQTRGDLNAALLAKAPPYKARENEQ